MNDQQKQQLATLLSKFSEQEKIALKEQMGVDLEASLDPENIDPELANMLIESGALTNKPDLTKVHGGNNQCSFCGGESSEVGALISSPSGAKICKRCILQYQKPA